MNSVTIQPVEIDFLAMLSEREEEEKVLDEVLSRIFDELKQYILINKLENKISHFSGVSYRNGNINVSYYIYEKSGRYKVKQSGARVAKRSKRIPITILSDGKSRPIEDIMKDWGISSQPLKEKLLNT
jgi:hypothetical protein